MSSNHSAQSSHPSFPVPARLLAITHLIPLVPNTQICVVALLVQEVSRLQHEANEEDAVNSDQAIAWILLIGSVLLVSLTSGKLVAHYAPSISPHQINSPYILRHPTTHADRCCLLLPLHAGGGQEGWRGGWRAKRRKWRKERGGWQLAADARVGLRAAEHDSAHRTAHRG